jgi:hypothetical protein
VNPPEFTDLPEGLSVFGVPEGYAVCGIAELGHALREELISKWTARGEAGMKSRSEDRLRAQWIRFPKKPCPLRSSF